MLAAKRQGKPCKLSNSKLESRTVPMRLAAKPQKGRTPRKSNAASAPRLGTPLILTVAARLPAYWLLSLKGAGPEPPRPCPFGALTLRPAK